jgi:hypothetical protein
LIKSLALLLGLVSIGWAQPQPNVTPIAYRDFSGGYVDNVDPVQIKPNESPDMVNVVVDDPVGSLKPRKGFVRCGNLPSGNVATNLYEYSRSDGTRRLIVTDNQNVYSTPDCQSWTTIVSGMASSAQVYFATVRDKLWIVNGSTWPATWDGTSYTLLDGRANTPNPTVPKCAFVEFWKERVWCGAPSGDPSGVDFSALTDNAGNDLDPSTGTLAWPINNNFEIDQNAGSRLYGLRAYRNRLYAFKDNGVWEIGFESEFNNFVRKTYATVGSRYQTSITESDGILYFTGRDGIYAFDGDNAVRISKKIENKFKALNQPLISQNYKTWTSQGDFNGGTFSSATANDISGSVTISSQPASLTNGDFESGSLSPSFNCHVYHNYGTSCDNENTWAESNVSTTGICNIFSSAQTPPFHTGSVIAGTYSAQVVAVTDREVNSGSISVFNVSGTTVASTGDGSTTSISTKTLDLSGAAGQTVILHIRAQSACNRADLYSSTFTARGQMTIQETFDATGGGDGGYSGYTAIDNIQLFQYYSSATWTSDIYNTVAVSTWGALTATDVSNGGSVAYEIRYGTNTGAVQSMAFQPILPGAIIPAATDQIRVQVRANLTASSDLTDSPRLDDVQIAWNSGGNNTQKIYAGSWNNQLWISASSGSATTNNLVLQRAKATLDAWMPQGMQIGPMARYNDFFYAAASTHSAIYRMDYGTNDDGAAISWYWTSKDENWGQPNNAKYLQELDADYRNDASCNIRMGYVQDANTTYCVGNLPAPNASLASGVGSRRLNFNGGPAYTYRLKVCDDQKDQAPTIIGLTPWARMIPRRGD